MSPTVTTRIWVLRVANTGRHGRLYCIELAGDVGSWSLFPDHRELISVEVACVYPCQHRWGDVLIFLVFRHGARDSAAYDVISGCDISIAITRRSGKNFQCVMSSLVGVLLSADIGEIRQQINKILCCGVDCTIILTVKTCTFSVGVSCPLVSFCTVTLQGFIPQRSMVSIQNSDYSERC